MTDPKRLLAVDLGLRCGIALFDDSADLLRYRSTNFGSRSRLKSAVYGVIRDAGPPAYLVVEGSADLGKFWTKAARKQGADVIEVTPEQWRKDLLDPHQRRSGAGAKDAADELARRIIEKTGADSPTSLRDDAAEAIAIGWWALSRVGWRD